MVVLVIAAIVGLLLWGHHVRTSQQVASILEDLRDRNQPLTLRALDDSYSIPSSERNAAPLYSRAFDACKEYPSSLDELWKRAEEPSDHKQQTLKAHLTTNAKALALLHKGAQIPRCRYPINLRNGPQTLLPHLSGLKDGIELLCLEASYHADTGSGGDAVESLLAAWRLAESLRREPAVISQRVRISGRQIVLEACEAVLNRCSLRREQLSRLREGLDSVSPEGGLQRAARGSLAMGLDLYRNPPDRGVDSFIGRDARPERLTWLRAMNGIMKSFDLPFPQRLKSVRRIEDNYPTNRGQQEFSRVLVFIDRRLVGLAGGNPRGRNPYGFLWADPKFFRESIGQQARVITHARLVRTALAIEMYRRDHQGRPPQALSKPASSFQSIPPINCFTGESIEYDASGPGYILKAELEGNESLTVRVEH